MKKVSLLCILMVLVVFIAIVSVEQEVFSEEPKQRVMSIHLNIDGTIDVEGVTNKVQSASDLEEVSKVLLEELQKKPLLRSWEQISVITTNPCVLAKVGGSYKWVCW